MATTSGAETNVRPTVLFGRDRTYFSHGDVRMANTILLVEDDLDNVKIVRLYLGQDGHQVVVASDGLEGLRLARSVKPDLVVLDVMLPGMNGLEICQTLRNESDVPIVMLTARVEEEDRLTGLELGADDYITKPYSPRELTARIRAVLRRAARDAADGGPQKIEHGAIKLDLRLRAAYAGGKPLTLTPTEFRILVLFMREPGRTFARDNIIDRVFGYDFDGFDRTVDAHVSNLRRKLRAKKDDPRYIHTVYNVGYRFGDA